MEYWIKKAKELMAERNLRYKQLIGIDGIETTGGIGHYFSGRNKPSAEWLRGLAERLEVSMDELMGVQNLKADHVSAQAEIGHQTILTCFIIINYSYNGYLKHHFFNIFFICKLLK